MASTVYILCALTAAACSILLLRGYLSSRSRLLLWSGLCFLGLTANNVLVILDVQVFTDVDLFWVRNATSLASMLLLLYGLIWDTH